MKFLTTIIVSVFSLSVFAQDGEIFGKAKEHHRSNLDKRISYLQEQKACAAASTDKDGMKACREAHKAKVNALKEENEGWKNSMKSERMGRQKKK